MWPPFWLAERGGLGAALDHRSVLVAVAGEGPPAAAEKNEDVSGLRALGIGRLQVDERADLAVWLVDVAPLEGTPAPWRGGQSPTERANTASARSAGAPGPAIRKTCLIWARVGTAARPAAGRTASFRFILGLGTGRRAATREGRRRPAPSPSSRPPCATTWPSRRPACPSRLQLVELARPSAADRRVDERRELVLRGHRDAGLALLELDRLGAVEHREHQLLAAGVDSATRAARAAAARPAFARRPCRSSAGRCGRGWGSPGASSAPPAARRASRDGPRPGRAGGWGRR